MAAMRSKRSGTSASGGLIYIWWGMMDGALSGVMESRICWLGQKQAVFSFGHVAGLAVTYEDSAFSPFYFGFGWVSCGKDLGQAL